MRGKGIMNDKSNGKSQIILVCLATLVACAALSATEGDPLEAKASQGDATSQFQLGLKYADGEGVPKNDTKAVE